MKRPPQLTRWNEIISMISYRIPWTYYGILRGALRGATTVVDVACGPGIPMYFLNHDKQYRVTAVDLFDEYLKQAKESGIYDDVVKSDIRALPFTSMSFDTVVALHIIEHLPKKEGLAFLEQLERIAKRRVIIATPTGFLKQDGYDGNFLQEHKSGWEPEDFERLGYQVIGQGWNLFHGEGLIARGCQLLGPFAIIRDVISIILHPFLSRRPHHSYQIVCIKDL